MRAPTPPARPGARGRRAGTTIPIGDFFVAKPTDDAKSLNNALAKGQNLLLTPGVYHLDRSLDVKRPDTVVLGLGFPTLVPDNGTAPITLADAVGIKVAGILVDAGPKLSPILFEVGKPHAHKSNAADPTTLSDVFFRIGGAAAGKATTALVVNSDDVILDDIWAWRADHGNGVGWTTNPADTGVIVNGDDVTAYGLFVEHFQKTEVIWNGERGRTIMFQNEMPYDVPDQASWLTTDLARIPRLQGGRLREDARGLGCRELRVLQRQSLGAREPWLRGAGHGRA